MRYLLLVFATVFLLSGCAALEDYHYCFVNHRRAYVAWYANHSRPDRRDLSSDYEHGWRKGYFDVSTGGCGEPPVIPPNKYWSTKYQCEAGQAAIEDWYAGFQDGAIAAESAGSGAFHWIPTGPTIPTETVGWLAPENEGALVVPFEEGHTSVDGSQHFLQPFAPPHTWPPLPTNDSQKVVENMPVTPEPLPVQTVQKAVPPPPAELKPDVNTVPPVITEE